MRFKTYLTKLSVNGNRSTLILEEETKTYVTSGGHLGDHGETVTKLRLKDIKEIEKDLISQGYKKVSWEEMHDLIFKRS